MFAERSGCLFIHHLYRHGDRIRDFPLVETSRDEGNYVRRNLPQDGNTPFLFGRKHGQSMDTNTDSDPQLVCSIQLIGHGS